jgi:hypothetical protein
MQSIQDKIDTEREDLGRMTVWELRALARQLKLQFPPFQIQITKAKRGVIIAYIEVLKQMIGKYKETFVPADHSRPKSRIIPIETRQIEDGEIIVPMVPNAVIGNPYLKAKNILTYKDDNPDRD